MSIVTDKETIFVDELIRENARLTVQHEADLLMLEQMRERYTPAEEYQAKVAEACAYADKARAEADAANAALRQAVADLHFVMAGGDPCKVCTVKCLMGEGNCKPVWRGEEA